MTQETSATVGMTDAQAFCIAYAARNEFIGNVPFERRGLGLPSDFSFERSRSLANYLELAAIVRDNEPFLRALASPPQDVTGIERLRAVAATLAAAAGLPGDFRPIAMLWGKRFFDETGAVMPKRSIMVSFEVITPESSELGDAEERGVQDRLEFDNALEAALWLQDQDVFESTPGQMWLTVADGATNFQTGAVTTNSYHLAHFSPDEERAILDHFHQFYPQRLNEMYAIDNSGDTEVLAVSVSYSDQYEIAGVNEDDLSKIIEDPKKLVGKPLLSIAALCQRVEGEEIITVPLEHRLFFGDFKSPTQYVVEYNPQTGAVASIAADSLDLASLADQSHQTGVSP